MTTINSNKPTRAEKYLNRLVENRTLTPCGKATLEQAFDPFPDFTRKPCGWFVEANGASIVRLVKDSMQIFKPAGLPAGNWDCHIVPWPWEEPVVFVGTQTRLNNAATYPPGSITGVTMGGLWVVGTPPGAKLDVTAITAGVPTQFVMGMLTLNQTQETGLTRVVGQGYEIHDTTAQLYKQGTLTCYNLNAASQYQETFSVSDGISQSTFTGIPVRFPPASPSEALFLDGTRQWEVKDGIYSVARCINVENPPIQPGCVLPCVMNNVTDELPYPASNVAQFLFPKPIAFLPGTGATSIRPMVPMKMKPWSMHGTILSGLNEVATLLLNKNTYLQAYPGQANPGDAQLATSDHYTDQKCASLYSELIQSMPVGVVVADNGLGEWILDGVSKLGSFIGPMLIGSGNPLAMAAGTMLTAAGQGARAFQKPSWENSGGRYDETHAWNQSVLSADAVAAKTAAKKAKKAKKKLAKAKAQSVARPKKPLPPPGHKHK